MRASSLDVSLILHPDRRLKRRMYPSNQGRFGYILDFEQKFTTKYGHGFLEHRLRRVRSRALMEKTPILMLDSYIEIVKNDAYFSTFVDPGSISPQETRKVGARCKIRKIERSDPLAGNYMEVDVHMDANRLESMAIQ